jgi:hypothetical protein
MLDDLCARLGKTSAGTVRRKELVAAILSEVSRDDPRELANLIARYREAPAWPGEFKQEKPGPRSAQSS